MAVHSGKLYCGTLPSGRVYSLRSGQCASMDSELPPGWHHLVAVRAEGELRLYLDGALVGQSPDRAQYKLDNDQPLLIGFGSHDYFRGTMRDVRLYGRALTAAEIEQLAHNTQLRGSQ